MSIANEISRLQTSKADTKEQVNIDKDYINTGIDFIGSETVDDYDEKIQEMQEAYKAFIPVNTTSDTQIDAPKGGTIIGKTLKGNTSQSGTPTPSSPVPVNNVTGLQTISIGEKNLFKPTLGTTTINGVTFTKNNDGTYTANGTASDFIGLEVGQFIFGSAKTITYSGAPSNASMSTYSFNLKKVVGATKTWLQDELGTGKTITTEANVIYLATLVIRSGVSVSNVVFKPMIELGSTKTEFEPFKGKQYEINLGKNLIEPKMATATSNGITCTNNGDGSFTLNGTATANATFRLNQSTYDGRDNLKHYSGTYTLSCNELQTNMRLLVMQNQTWASPLHLVNTTSTTGTFDKQNCFVYVQVDNGKTLDNLTIRPMLEKGPVATSYTPYFTPLELNKIGNYQDYIRKGTGKNLFNSKSEIQEDWFGGSGITYSIDNGVYTLNGTNTRQYIYLRYNLELEAGNYFFSGCPSGGSGTGYGAFVKVGSTSYWDFGNGVSFNVPIKQEVLVYPVRIGNETITANNLVFKPMIQKGTIATSFEPYSCTGKNLFNGELQLGSYGSSGEKIDTTNTYRNINAISVSPNTKYTFSINGTTQKYVVLFYDVNKNYISQNSSLTTGTFTTPNNTYFVNFRSFVADFVNDFVNLKVQLERGSQPTSYEPYVYSTLKDKWYIEKNVLKLVVPNEVAVSMQNNNKRVYVNGINLGSNNILRNTSSSQTYGLYCDILEEVTAGQTWNGTQGISYDYDVGKNLGCIDFAISGLTTVAEYQNALKGKAIYAIANTPEYILIENEDLIEQLEKIMPLLEGQNNISVDGSIPVTMDLDYIVRADRYLIGNRREGK